MTIYFQDALNYTTGSEMMDTPYWFATEGTDGQTLHSVNELDDCNDQYGIYLETDYPSGSTNTCNIVNTTNLNRSGILWITSTFTVENIVLPHGAGQQVFNVSSDRGYFRLSISHYYNGDTYVYALRFLCNFGSITTDYDNYLEIPDKISRTTYKVDIGIDFANNDVIIYVNNILFDVANITNTFYPLGLLTFISYAPDSPYRYIDYFYYRDFVISDYRVFPESICLEIDSRNLLIDTLDTHNGTYDGREYWLKSPLICGGGT